MLSWALYYYDTLAFKVHHRFATNPWFDGFIMINILCVGVGIYIGLSEADQSSASAATFLRVTDSLTFWIFLFEAGVKIMSCGSKPWVYFLAHKDGTFNTFDFVVVAVSVAYSPYFGATTDVSDVQVLRLARLLRLFDFIEHVPEVRVLIHGLLTGLDSVGYILLLLFLVVYIFGVLGVILFGENDPANFDDVATAMLTLFQTATLTSWSAISYVSFYGCDAYAGNGYVNGVEQPLPGGQPRSKTTMGATALPLWSCVNPEGQRGFTFAFFVVFILLAAMVIMSLFIGVITIGMFTEYAKYQDEQADRSYKDGLTQTSQELSESNSVLRMAVDFVMGLENKEMERSLIVVKSGFDGVTFRRRAPEDDDDLADGTLSNGNPKLPDAQKTHRFSRRNVEPKQHSQKKPSAIDENGFIVSGGAPASTVSDAPPEHAGIAVGRFASSATKITADTAGAAVETMSGAAEDFFNLLKRRQEATRKLVISPAYDDVPSFERTIISIVISCRKVEEAALFQNAVTACIIIAGVTVGLSTDARGDEKTLKTVDLAMLLAFTAEALIRIIACGKRPGKYFRDRWNQFDILIVINGWLDQLDVFSSSFLVVFRLLRLLRVFRVARAFPKLRSIVSSLLEALGSVGWMVILMIIFNYIAACIGMILFQHHDPFYWGDPLQASFTIFQISTLDVWDVVMRINMFGCDTYGYPVANDAALPDAACTKPKAFGYVATVYFVAVIIAGAIILPTMLIGVVSINFDKSSQRFENERQDSLLSKAHLAVLREDVEVCAFFDDERVDAFEGIFTMMDADRQGRLDLNEVSPFIAYLVRDFLGHQASQEEIENIVLFFDESDSGDLNFGEFLTCIRYFVKARMSPKEWSFPTDDNLSRISESLEQNGSSRGAENAEAPPPFLLSDAPALEERLAKLGFLSVDDMLSKHEAGFFTSAGPVSVSDLVPSLPSKTPSRVRGRPIRGGSRTPSRGLTETPPRRENLEEV